MGSSLAWLMRKLCPKCGREMILLLVSYVCDWCDKGHGAKIDIKPTKPRQRDDDTEPGPWKPRSQVSHPEAHERAGKWEMVESVNVMHADECDCVRCGMEDFARWKHVSG